jgi:hypothetical protein
MPQANVRVKPLPVYTPTFIKPSSVHTHLLACEDGTECSETSTFKTQTPGNYPKEIIQVIFNYKNRKNKKLPGEIHKYEALFSGSHNRMP